ncbi:MAG: type I secretion system permease/ATPase [Litoreibacter sp.]|nr:type I secretion system permease/ATPase [Litoreibacter sp.]
MQQGQLKPGRAELRDVCRGRRYVLGAAFLFSVVFNLLMLTGPLYMLQIYDRVLSSRSEHTLIALSGLALFIFLIMGVLDHARGRLLARIGVGFQEQLQRRVFIAALRGPGGSPGRGAGPRDLFAIQGLLSSPAALAVMDLPWSPVFLASIFIFHPMLGYLALAGSAILLFVTYLNHRLTRQAGDETAGRADQLYNTIMTEAETARGLGMLASGFESWENLHIRDREKTLSKNDLSGTLFTLARTLRLILQSAMLGLGAYLVLQGELTAGAMIAASILMGRALAPIEATVSHWPVIERARSGWQRLEQLLSNFPAPKPHTPLPRPEAHLSCEQLTVIPPGESQARLRMLSFEVKPGTALGVLGPSGSGKSTLAKALIGVWPAAGGGIRLGGARLEQYDENTRATHIGYLPQHVAFFEGTIAENIARLKSDASPSDIIAAARTAGAHDLILRQPNGYDTMLSAASKRLSGGERQRIGLARALFGNPIIVVMDEPNASLDNEGSKALNASIQAIKATGSSVVLMTHRPSAITQCEHLLVLKGGVRTAFGPRLEVLGTAVANAMQIADRKGPAAAI